MLNRLENCCAEVAISKAAEKLFGGRVTYNPALANNDEQCDLSTLFSQFRADDLVINDPKLGGKAKELRVASTQALSTAQGNQKTFDRILTERQSLIKEPIKKLLLEKLTVLDPDSIYMLRTGVESGGGHFHIVYFNVDNNCWILSSGSHRTEGPEDILITAKLELGEAADKLIDCGSEWGENYGNKSLHFYQMTRERILISAKYIEKFRALSDENAREVFPQSILDEILANERLLSLFGLSEYWTTSGHFQLPIYTVEEQEHFLVNQCVNMDNSGALDHLVAKGYFNDREKAGRLFEDLVENSKVESIKKILDDNLIDLTQWSYEQCSSIYLKAYDLETPQHQNRALHILQNKMTELDGITLPFTIDDVCVSLNATALAKMYSNSSSVLNRDRYIDLLKNRLIDLNLRKSTIQEYNEIFRQSSGLSTFLIDCLNIFVAAFLLSLIHI